MSEGYKMDPLLIKDIVHAIKAALPNDRERFVLHEPLFQGNEWKYVKECLDEGWVSSVGKFVDLFEQKLAEFTGVKKAIACVNGTAALHICLKLAGVNPNDEVLVPTLTFVATANAVRYCDAIPHFVDSEEATLGVDPGKLEEHLKKITQIRSGQCFNKTTGRRIAAMVAMHTLGHPVDLDPLLEVCQAYHLPLVEDAAEALGSFYKGKHTGHWGKVSALSFNGNKVITTGGGGAILTNDETLAKKAKHLTTTAKVSHPWKFLHDEVGYNYRLPNINAALGCAQLEMLPKFLINKRRLAKKYQTAFAQVQGVSFFSEPQFAQSNYWLNALLLDKGLESSRDLLLEETHKHGLMTRPAWTLMHALDMFSDFPKMGDLSCSQSIEQRLINLPSSAFLGGAND